MRFFTLLILIFIGTANTAQAQPCAGQPGRSAQTAFAVCGTLVFHEANLPNCSGPDLPPSGCPDPVTSNSSAWYKFHCYQSGTLGFLITPGSAADDYDWELMDYTGRPPGDVYIANLMLSLNISGVTGPTGCTPAGLLNIHCAGGPAGSQYNQMADLIAGHDYLLMVTNYSTSGTGYDLIFSGGTAVLTDNLPPAITNVSQVGCNTALLKVTFSEDVKCSSVTPTGSEFSITPAGPVITGVTSTCASPLGSITTLTIQLQNPLPTGNYTLTVNPGTDGNTFTDVCDEDMVTGFSIPFTANLQTPVTVSNITYTGCAPTVLDVAFTKPLWCTSVTPSGSEFSIVPGNPVINSVQSTCSTGGLYDNLLHIVLQNPLPVGNYQLVINNGADGNTVTDTCGNSIPVGNSTPFAITASTPPPIIQNVSFGECHPDQVILTFDKPVNCASLTAAGSEFSITPGVWPISSIVSNCGAATYTNQVTLNLLNPLTAGNFNVKINNGTDANTLSDTCFSFIVPGYSKAFSTTQASAPKFDSVQFDKCSPAFVKVFYSHAIKCSTVSPDGSDFSITGPGAVTITSAGTDATTCGAGYTNWIMLQLSAPINSFGNYVLHNGIGTDADGIIDTCNAKQNVNETIGFTVLGKPNPNFNSLVKWGCTMDTIALSHPGGNGANAWTWIFSDGTTASGQVVTHIFPIATVTADVKLIVSNGFCSDSLTKSFPLGNVFHAGFKINSSDTFCINTPVNFTDTSSGAITAYLWNFGDLTQFNGQNPPPHSYPVFNDYTVQLVVTDNHGCTDTARKVLHVTATADIDFTGLRSQYCTGNEITLMRKISRNIISYLWDNGDGKTFQDKVIVQFTYATEGVYTIKLSGIDRYCGPTVVTKTVPVYALPLVDIGRDTVLCPDTRMLIGVLPVAGYTYLWNTGASSPQIYSDIFTRNYLLKVDNHGCNASDALSIKVLPACLIRVPNAFTPNGDGLNDKLKAVNADLATNFSFKVYNRFGQLVFSTKSPVEGWDGYYKGVQAETGVFVWMLSYTDPWTGKEVKEKGSSILLR